MFVKKHAYLQKKHVFLWKTSIKINVNPEAQYMCIHVTFKKLILGINVSIKLHTTHISKKWQKYIVVQFQPQCNFIFSFGLYLYHHLQLSVNAP